MLPDVLAPGLRVVFCGTAAGKRSAELQLYYAGIGNRFWRVLHDVGFTDRQLAPSEFRKLLDYQIGLTNLVKGLSGMDHTIDFKGKGISELLQKIEQYQPRFLCFNGKRAAQEFLEHDVDYGLRPVRIGETRLFVAPSTSLAGVRYWDETYWAHVKQLSCAPAEQVKTPVVLTP